jgi:transcriptional regulator with XRE-family HTH domain
MSTDPSEIFPARLKAARGKRGMDQEGLAKKARLNATAISHFETGRRKPSFDNLKRLAEALSVTTDYLLGRAEMENGDAAAGATGAVSAGVLFRNVDFDSLTADDLETAEGFMKMLTEKNRKKRGET